MQSPQAIFELLRAEGVDFFAGVPDSLLKDFCAYITDHTGEQNHVITANEGNAIALASGHYLGTGSPAVVYMQNSGLGNAINPLLSLADGEVYSLPMLLMIGWRGEPGVKDEPQHVKQGRVTPALLDAMEIPHFELDADTADAGAVIRRACAEMQAQSKPVAIVVRKGTFEKYTLQSDVVTEYPMNREAALKCVLGLLDGDDVIVSTTGKLSRELYDYRESQGEGHSNDFLTVGAMGHTASIAMGVTQGRPGHRTICLDGDGSVIMHMGALAVIGQSGLSDLVHVVINNGAHDSVGGQPTTGFAIDIARIAAACGYQKSTTVTTEREIRAVFPELANSSGPSLLEIRVNKGARDDLGRPQTTPVANRDALMRRLGC